MFNVHWTKKFKEAPMVILLSNNLRYQFPRQKKTFSSLKEQQHFRPKKLLMFNSWSTSPDWKQNWLKLCTKMWHQFKRVANSGLLLLLEIHEYEWRWLQIGLALTRNTKRKNLRRRGLLKKTMIFCRFRQSKAPNSTVRNKRYSW